jgi:S-adenosylmethionine decarboxylase
MERFEGPEKRLEILLSAPQAGLRGNADARWRAVVRATGAEVCRVFQYREIDSYILSESSLFVWDDRILLLTCGQTTPVAAIPLILDFVDLPLINAVFYKRKNMTYPADQPTDFEEDTAALSRYFKGETIRLGNPKQDHLHLFHCINGSSPLMREATLQVLMHDLQADATRPFSRKFGAGGQEQAAMGSIRSRLPDMRVDEFFFDPQGYSANAVGNDRYFTLHVTPEPAASYASFETNVHRDRYDDLINTVIKLFKPGRCAVCLTAGRSPATVGAPACLPPVIDGYRTLTTEQRELGGGYRLIFQNFKKAPNE